MPDIVDTAMTGAEQTPNIPRIYRVKGIPLGWNRPALSTFLINETSLNLQEPGFKIHSLAPELHNQSQTATIVSIDGRELPSEIRTEPRTEYAPDGQGMRPRHDDQFEGPTTLYCDAHFHGLTTLYCPQKQDVLVKYVTSPFRNRYEVLIP